MFAVARTVLGKLGLRWFEWLFLGVMFSVSVASYFLYQKVGALKEDLTKAEQVMKYNEQTEDQLVETLEVDRDISYDFFTEQMSLVRSQYHRRGSVIDEYLRTKSVRTIVPDRIEPEVETIVELEDPPEPDPVVAEVPKVQPPEPSNPPPTTVEEKTDAPKEPVENNDLDGLQHLVDSMQFADCQAKTRGGDCTPEKSVD